MSALDTLSHWRLARDPDGLAWLTFDRAAGRMTAELKRLDGSVIDSQAYGARKRVK